MVGRSWSCVHWELLPGCNMKDPLVHTHPNAIETYEILEGEMEFFIRDKWVTAKKGDKLTVPIGVTHAFRNPSGKVVRVFNTHQPALKMENYFDKKNVFTSYYKAISFVDAVKKIEYDLDDFKGQESLVVSGIANPKSFLNILNKVHVNTLNRLIFRDHKNYTLKEVQQIRKQFYITNSHSVVTTEKDAVKLSRFKREFDDIEIFYLKINLCMDDQESFKQYLINKLKNTS